MRKEVPSITVRDVRGKHVFLTGSTDIHLVRKIINVLQTERAKGGYSYSYQVNSATLDEVFIDLNAERREEKSSLATLTPIDDTPPNMSAEPISTASVETVAVAEKDGVGSLELDSEKATAAAGDSGDTGLVLTPGKKPSYTLALFVDAYTIFLKRFIVLRRSFLLPMISITIVICASCIPLFFMKNRVQTCEFVTNEKIPQTFTYPYSFYPAAFSPVVVAPAALGSAFGSFPNASAYIKSEADNSSFVNLFETDYVNQTFGGVSLGTGSAQSLFAYEATALENKGLSALNLLSNVMLDEISQNATAPFRINAIFQFLASPDFGSTAVAFKWLAFVYAALLCMSYLPDGQQWFGSCRLASICGYIPYPGACK